MVNERYRHQEDERMSSSVIKIVCPNLQCRKVLSVPVKARGKNVRCRACGYHVTVPGQSPEPQQKTQPTEQKREEMTTEKTPAQKTPSADS